MKRETATFLTPPTIETVGFPGLRLVKVRIKISVSTDSGNVAFEVCRESTFQNESGEKWKNRVDAMQDVKNTASPLAYEDMQRFVEELSKSAGISPFPIPGYDTIQKDESE